MKMKDFLEQYKVLKNIKRFSMETVVHPQNLCDHGYNVGTLFYLICKELKVHISSDDLFLVMNHDFAETYTGDLNKRVKDKNSTTKKAWREIESEVVPPNSSQYKGYDIQCVLATEEYEIFQLADEMDAYLYCKKELSSGNKNLDPSAKFYILSIIERLNKLNLRWEEETNEFFKQ